MPPDDDWTHDELVAIYERRFAELGDVDGTTTFVGRPVVPVSFEVADMSPWLREQRRDVLEKASEDG